MTLKIEIELSDEDVERFRAMFSQARRVADTMDRKEIIDATRRKIEQAAAQNPKGFIRDRVKRLQMLVRMVNDDTWRLPADECERVVRALAYFVNPDDLIPDQTPGLGFLDDAIAVEIVLESLGPDVDAYAEFCQFREAETARRRNQGLPTDITQDDWLADRRASLHSRLGRLRTTPAQGWTVRGIGI